MKNDSKSIFKRKITHPLITFLRQGLTPETMSKTIASGLLIGTIPIPGTSTLLCTALSLGFRMNLGLIQLVNYLAFPLQLLLFVPFYNIASRITGRAFFSKITEISLDIFEENSKFQPVAVEPISVMPIMTAAARSVPVPVPDSFPDASVAARPTTPRRSPDRAPPAFQ